MLSPALKKIGRLDIAAADYEPAFDIGVRKFDPYDRREFQIGISASGIEATRNLNRDELIAVRDWINEARAAIAKTTGGAP